MIIQNKKVIILFILIFSINSSANVYAALKIKTQIDPGAMETYSKDQQFWAEQTQIKKDEDLQIENGLEKEKINQIKNGAKVVFELKGVEFIGNTIISSKDLSRYFELLTGKEVSFNEITRALSEITQFYQSMGYITSKAYISPQKIVNGIIKINILEGKIGQINVNKTKWTKTSYIKNNLIKPYDLQESKIFNVRNLKSSLNDINNKEYLKGKVILKKGLETESTDIIFDIKDRFPLSLSPSWDNFGREYTGIQRAGLNINNQNVTGFGDTLNNSLNFSKGILGLNSSYIIPINSSGATFKVDYSHYDVNIGEDLKSQQITGRSESLKATISMPLYRKNDIIVNSDIAYYGLISKTESSITPAYDNKYELRAIKTGVNILKTDKTGRLSSRTEVSTGLPFFGAKTVKEDESDATSKFIKIESNITRFQLLPLNSYGIFKLSGQYSPSHLLSAEQTQAGGMYSVRGFKEGALSGDIGYNLSLELRKAIPYLPRYLSIPYKKNKSLKIPLKDRIFFAVFYDQAIVRELGQNVPYTNKDFLQSTGAGLNFSITKYLNANMYVGVPLGRKKYDAQESARFHFGISSDLI
jgi:hemolysin activation/secretion protein